MQHQSLAPSLVRRRAWRADLLLAFALAAVLSLAWALKDWGELRHLVLPDPDDMMRLAQVRDWLAGQGINDWTQHRMAPPLGAPMHWSRVNDFGIAGIILAATPLVGRHAAELAAVILYPALLFATAMTLSARIARRLWGAGAAPIAALLAAMAYPGTTLFVPGRIDHHALQVVLTLATILALMRRPSAGGGVLAGVAVAISMVIGLETVPQVAALIAAAFVLWVVKGTIERPRLMGFAAGLAGTTALFLAFLRPSYWNPVLCDAFTPASSDATLAAAAALALLAAATPRLRDWRARAGMGVALGAAVLGAVLVAFPHCVTGPYGEVDPFLRREFIPHIEEANGLFALPLWKAFAIGGLMAVESGAVIWMLLRHPRRWAVALPMAGVVAVSALITLAQVRGTYLGAPAGVPALAGIVLAARRRVPANLPAVLAAWLACTGIVYNEIPVVLQAVALRFGAPPLVAFKVGSDCNQGDVWEQVSRYPPGLTMAPTYMASYSLGATRLGTVGAGYHRNNAGNMAMYRYFLSPPDRAARIARAWRVHYVLFCPGDFSEIDVTRRWPGSVAALLQADRPPPGFQRLPLRGAALRFYRISG